MTTFFFLTQSSLLLSLLIGALWFRRSPKHWLDFRAFGFALLGSSFLYVQATAQRWMWAGDHGFVWSFYFPTVLFVTGLGLAAVPQPKDPVRSRRTYGLVAIGLCGLCSMAALLMPPVREQVGLAAAALGATLLPDAIHVAKHGETPFFDSPSRLRSGARVAYYGGLAAATLYCFIDFMSRGNTFANVDSLLRSEYIARANPTHSRFWLEWAHWDIIKYAVVAASPVLILWCVYMVSQGLERLRTPGEAKQPATF